MRQACESVNEVTLYTVSLSQNKGEFQREYKKDEFITKRMRQERMKLLTHENVPSNRKFKV